MVPVFLSFELISNWATNIRLLRGPMTCWPLRPHHVVVFTGPPTHSVGDQYCFARWRLSSSVVVCNTSRRRMHMQRNPPGSSTRRRASSVKSRQGDNWFLLARLHILFCSLASVVVVCRRLYHSTAGYN